MNEETQRFVDEYLTGKPKTPTTPEETKNLMEEVQAIHRRALEAIHKLHVCGGVG